jgi:hypothetical protein
MSSAAGRQRLQAGDQRLPLGLVGAGQPAAKVDPPEPARQRAGEHDLVDRALLTGIEPGDQALEGEPDIGQMLVRPRCSRGTGSMPLATPCRSA